jgi:hypothetical protein
MKSDGMMLLLVPLMVVLAILGFGYEMRLRQECGARGGVLVKDHSWDQYGCVAGVR